MKRKLFAFLLCVLLLSSGLLMASAATSPVQDYANLMTSAERDDLLRQIQGILIELKRTLQIRYIEIKMIESKHYVSS